MRSSDNGSLFSDTSYMLSRAKRRGTEREVKALEKRFVQERLHEEKNPPSYGAGWTTGRRTADNCHYDEPAGRDNAEIARLQKELDDINRRELECKQRELLDVQIEQRREEIEDIRRRKRGRRY